MIHDDSGLWNSLRTSFPWTELRLPVNCASLHIGVDEVLINRCRLLDIYAWEVFRTPWRCSLPVCLRLKLHPDKIQVESCWEMITSPKNQWAKDGSDFLLADRSPQRLQDCVQEKWPFKWFNISSFARLRLTDRQSVNPDRRQGEHFKRNMSVFKNNRSRPKCLPGSKTR